MRMRRLGAVGLAMILAGTSPAHAGLVIDFVEAVTPDGTVIADYRDLPGPGEAQPELYRYAVRFDSRGGTEQLWSGDFITLYDTGPASVSDRIGSFSGSQAPVGPSPRAYQGFDHAYALNFTLTYEDPHVLGGDASFGTIDVASGPDTQAVRFVGYATRAEGVSGPAFELGSVVGPHAVGLALAPEPATLIPATIAGLALAGYGWRRRRRAAA